MSTIEDWKEKLEREQNETDPHAWQDWPISELTDDGEVHVSLGAAGIKTIGQAWELSSSGQIDSQPLREAFDAFWLAYPDFRPEVSPISSLWEDPPESRFAVLECKEKLLHKIRSQNERVRMFEHALMEAKTRAKEAKDAWEASVMKLQSLIESASNGQQLLPGMDDEDAPESAQGGDEQRDAPKPPDASDEAWRAVTMASIGVKGKLLERLVEVDVDTLGAWSDWNGAGQTRAKIRGIGEGAIAKIADLCEAFWAKSNVAIIALQKGGT